MVYLGTKYEGRESKPKWTKDGSGLTPRPDKFSFNRLSLQIRQIIDVIPVKKTP